MTREQRILQTLAGVYSFYRADLTSFHSRAWLRFLARYEVEEVEKAFDLHMTDPSAGQFLPKPADVVKHLQGTQTDRSALAWSKVLQAIERVGGHQSVAFDDGAIHCAVEDLGGWPAVCAVTYDELPHLERRFCASYKAHAKAQTPHSPYLPGIAEKLNAIAQKKTQPPMLIGEPEAVRAVMACGGTEAVRITAGAPRNAAAAAVAMLGHITKTEEPKT